MSQEQNRIYAKDFAKRMSEASGRVYNISECQDFLDLFRRTVETLMLEGTEVLLTGFVTMQPKYSKPKQITSGLKKAVYAIPPGMTMKFSVSPAFQNELKKKFWEQQENQDATSSSNE